jgi:hypothetical protein
MKFAAAAIDHRFITTAINNDYGFDIVAALDRDPSSAIPTTLRGEWIGVSVRPTTKASGRILLERGDAHALLDAQFVAMVSSSGCRRPVSNDSRRPLMCSAGATGLVRRRLASDGLLPRTRARVHTVPHRDGQREGETAAQGRRKRR